jgi:hypothetical protein
VRSLQRSSRTAPRSPQTTRVWGRRSDRSFTSWERCVDIGSWQSRIEELLDQRGAPNFDVIHSLRQHRRDLLLQLAVASQTYASVRLIEQRNLEVIWALRSASATTLSALHATGLARLAQDIEDRRRRSLSQIRSGGEPR